MVDGGSIGFWAGYAWPVILISVKVLSIVLPLLVLVAYMTLAERKIMAAMQMRLGPNVVGPLGMWQAFADGL